MNTARSAIRLSPNAALWASAFVLIGLIIVAAGRMAESPARADLVASAGNITALTVQSQVDDVLLVIDNRSEHLTAYKVINQNSVELYRVYRLPQLFGDARVKATGHK